MMKMLVAVVAMSALGSALGGFPVKPRACYEATFRARVVAGPNVEDFPQLVDLVPMCVSRPTVTGERFAAVQWKFLDAAGRQIPRPHEGASPQTLFSREWRSYRYRFWTPENAATVDFFPINSAKANKAELDLVDVREVAPDGTLNFNADFSAADDAAWGWQLVGTAAFQNIAHGKSAINTMDGHLNGDLFPVKGGGSVKVEAVCSNPVIIGSRYSSASVRIMFYGKFADAAKKGSRGLVEPPVSPAGKHATATHVFRVPDGMCWARVTAWHGIVERITVTEEKR